MCGSASGRCDANPATRSRQCSSWRWASAPTPRCSRCSTACCSSRCRSASPTNLVLIQQGAANTPPVNGNVSIPELFGYRARLTSVRDLVEHHGMSFTLLNQGEPDRVDTGVVSANFFDMLGVRALARPHVPAGEDALGAEAVLVLSHRYWKDRFGGDPSVVGRVFEMNNRPHTVVGVLAGLSRVPAAQRRLHAHVGVPVPIGRRAGAATGRSSIVRRPDGARASGTGRHARRARRRRSATIAASFESDHAEEYEQAGVGGLTGARRAAAGQAHRETSGRWRGCCPAPRCWC